MKDEKKDYGWVLMSPDDELCAEALAVLEVAAPECPKCGGSMIRKIVRDGADIGFAFWRCVRFPECSGVRGM